MESSNLGPVTLEPFDFDPGSSQFDLSLDIRQRPEGLYCALNYDSDLYDRETARRILRHYQNILTAVTINIDERISTLNILSEEERRQILSDWNGTAAEYPRESSMHELIEARARSMPEAIAVVCRNETMTYGELNRRANAWAQRLRDRGVSRGVLVGILLQRSASFAVAVLSVLKAGGTYVPLDPKYPKQRLVEMLEVARCPLLITASKEAQNLPQTIADVLCVDQDDRHGIVAGNDPPVNEARPDDCSCVIFTSGSTGSPNGVLIEHRSLVNFSCFFRNYADLGVGDRVLQFNSPSFDMASHEIFPCWLAGATLVVWPESYAPSVPEFIEFLEREQITLIALPTAYWHEWVSQITSGDLPFPSRLRAVMIGGEKALTSKLAVWRNVIGGRVRLYNGYGPTETTIGSTFYDTDGGWGGADSVPIGRPIANATHYILDRNLQPVPIGIPGELYIGGAGVARGYLNRPELTAQKFIANPFRDVPDPRLYKTGDRVRYLADGTVEFLGRLDDQVKLRGFRIE
jgi:amino acid adenylation domain-containing protein